MATKQLFVPPVPPAPMLATPSAVPTGDQWVFEAKWDGARLAASCSGDRAVLYSRGGTNLSGSFPEICHALPEALNGHSAILDGEIVALDNHARPSFQRLQRRLHVSRPSANFQAALPTTLFVFDILQIDGTDVTGLPYLKRRGLLEDLWLGRAGPRIVTPPVWSDVSGDIVLDVMRELGLEGVVAKAATSTYQPGRRSRYSLKSVLRNATHVVVGGWIPSGTQPDAIGSLLVGAHDDTGEMVYCAHITSGFTDRARRALYQRLSGIGCDSPPFTNIDVGTCGPHVRWVRPLLVGRVEYREFLGRLRHAAWKGTVQSEPDAVRLPPRG